MRKIAIALFATLSLNGIAAQGQQKQKPATPQQAGQQKLTPAEQAEIQKKIAAVRAQLQAVSAQQHTKSQAKLAADQLKIVNRRLEKYRAMIQRATRASKAALQARVAKIQGAAEELNRTKAPIVMEKYWPHQAAPSHAARPGSPAPVVRPGRGPTLQHPLQQVAQPSITGLSVSSGQPGDPVVIHGSGFSASSTVEFLVANGNKQQASIDYVDGNDIYTSVPAVTGLLSYAGGVIVSNGVNPGNGNEMTAISPFQFQPEIVTVELPITGANVKWSDGGCNHQSSANEVSAYEDTCSINNGKASMVFVGGKFAGGTADDQYFSNFHLQNGWVLDSVDIVSNSGTFTGSAGAQVQGANIGSGTPSFKVHSYVNAWDSVGYSVTVYMHGPAGMPYLPTVNVSH